jgi:outer membrane receptor for ferrienterochelin and colicin
MERIIKGLLLIFGVLSLSCMYSQENLEGIVLGGTSRNQSIALNGANVYWMDSQRGTVTDQNGYFSLPYVKEATKLIISFVGYTSDTLTISGPRQMEHVLNPSNDLDEVVVIKKKQAIQKGYFETRSIITINSAELLKAACCNLSESFETNPAIDVNFSDALTGTKQIQMLGLTSPYLLITQENIPVVRGAAQAYGLTFTPGTWVESIQITKGAGSVLNGYESISGQINTELVKPSTDYALFVNGYANQNGRLEWNTHFNKKLTNNWSSGLYIHANRRDQKEDANKDGFLDAPLGKQLNILNRWQYQNPYSGWVSFLNIRFLNDTKQMGQTTFNRTTDIFTKNAWGSEIDTRRFETSLKLGYVYPELPFQSFGFQGAYSWHRQDSFFGLNSYDILHESMYSNLLFNSIIGDTKSKFTTGIAFAFDGYQELINTQEFSRTDASLGAFMEYSYDNLERLSLTAGLRVDKHNKLGTFITPRLHMRYALWDKGSLRGSVGRGKRAANIFAENQQLFASARQARILNNDGSIYGLKPEDAWNYGVGFLQGFTFFERLGNVTIDFYKTDFNNQIVVDWENPREVSFYNLQGKSTASSFHFEINYEILDHLELRTAYKYYDVQTDYQKGTLQKPLQAQDRFFTNLSYATEGKENGSQWRFDYTLQAIGQQRLPNTTENPIEYQAMKFSQAYSLMNAQVTKVFSGTFEVYLGGENLTNVTQSNPILGAEDPFGPYFDTTIVYAPIMGRMFYGGFRYKVF